MCFDFGEGGFDPNEFNWEELIPKEIRGLRQSIFPGIIAGLQQGPQAPQFPMNAPWDPNFGAGMNMYRGMGGLSQDYQPWQPPMMFDPSWLPQWPDFPNYMEPRDKEKKGGGGGGNGGGGDGKQIRKDQLKRRKTGSSKEPDPDDWE